MNVDRIPEWDLTPEVEAEIAQLLDRGFQEDFGGRSFHQLQDPCRAGKCANRCR